MKDAEKLVKKTYLDCRMLYPDGKPTWECGPGWILPLSRLSYRLERLNVIFRKKYGIYVQAEQIKEKFGKLRFYYAITECDPPNIEAFRKPITETAEYMKANIDFGIKSAEVIRPYMPKKQTRIPSKNIYLYRFMQLCYSIGSVISRIYMRGSKSHDAAVNRLDDIVSRAINMTVRECCFLCEVCGAKIGIESSPICKTSGWIRYLCRKCAKDYQFEAGNR